MSGVMQPTIPYTASSQVTLGRRQIVGGLLATAFIGPQLAAAESFGWSPTTENQKGDDQAAYETLHVDPSKIYALVSPTRAGYQKRDPNFAALFTATAVALDNKSRTTDRPLISDMLELFQLPFENSPHDPVPFCAAGLSYIAAVAYLGFWKKDPEFWAKNKTQSWSLLRDALHEIDRYHFFPSPSVWDMYYVALGKRRWVPKTARSPQKGWLVVYDFGGGADHVGLVLSATAHGLHTFECNTSGTINGSQQDGGVITERDRTLDHVKGFIRTDLGTPL